MKPDVAYRVDPLRAVWVSGRIGDELVNQVAPEILKRKSEGLGPITVFINSPRGSTRCLDIIDGLLKAPDQSGARHQVITVAVGNAFSAAATLLSLGDYSVAFSDGALIHFHGGRFSELEEVTVESATTYAESLRRHNEATAYRIAEVALSRIFLKYAILSKEFEGLKKSIPDCRSEIDCFCYALTARLSPTAQKIIQKSWRRFRHIEHLNSDVLHSIQKEVESGVISDDDFDHEVLTRVIRYEFTKQRESNQPRIGQPELGRMVEDYLILRDYHSGEHRELLGSVAAAFAQDLLTEDELTELEKLKQSPDPTEVGTWIQSKLSHRIQPFWYLTLSICRYLQEEENELSPIDAYWLGIVDELIGEDLPNLRTLAEMSIQTAAGSN